VTYSVKNSSLLLLQINYTHEKFYCRDPEANATILFVLNLLSHLCKLVHLGAAEKNVDTIKMVQLARNDL